MELILPSVVKFGDDSPAKMIARLSSRAMAPFHRYRVKGFNLKMNVGRAFPALLW